MSSTKVGVSRAAARASRVALRRGIAGSNATRDSKAPKIAAESSKRKQVVDRAIGDQRRGDRLRRRGREAPRAR